MRRFRFRPERLLHLNRQRERLARLELGRRGSAVRELEVRAAHLARSRETCLAADAPPGIGFALAAGLARTAAGVEQARQQAERQHDAARAAWLTQRAAVGALESLRERQRQVWWQGARRDEIRELDECVQAGARRRTL